MMKTKRFLALFIGLILMLTLVTTSAQAAEETKQVTIYFSNIKLLIDGKQTAVKDDANKTVEPFILDGVVYIPAKTLVDALKATGQYNTKYTSYFVGKPTTKPVKWLSLYEKPYVSVSDANRFRSKEDKNIQYLGGNVSSGHIELPGERFQGTWDVTYALNGVAQKVAGTICQVPGYWGVYEAIYEFYDDNDTLLYKSPIMTSNVAETDFEFDTGKALKLKLKITLTSASKSASTDCYIKNLRIYSSDYQL